MVLLGVKYFSWDWDVSIKRGQTVFAYYAYFNPLFPVERPDVFGNYSRFALSHHKYEVAGNQINSLRGFFLINVQNNLFFPPENKEGQYAEKKDDAGQNNPEKCFSKTFNIAALFGTN